MDHDTVLNDPNIDRVCGNNDLRCAVQFWILQHRKSKCEVDSKIIYGRILPYYHCDSTWYAPKNDSFKNFNGIYAQVIRINLYTESNIVRKLLVALSEGKSLLEISKILSLKWGEYDNELRFGKSKIQGKAVWRSPVYLPMDTDFYSSGIKSVHSGAGCFSASLIQLDKNKFIELDGKILKAFVEYCFDTLSSDTGMDFSGKDIERIGDIELIVFHQLDEKERCLFLIQWSKDRSNVIFKCNEGFSSCGNDHLIQVIFLNGSLHIHVSAIEVKNLKENSSFDYPIPGHLIDVVDGYQIEVFRKGNRESDWKLLFRDSGYFVREISIGSSISSFGGKVISAWLDPYTKYGSEDKRKIQNIKRGGHIMTSTMRYRESDPWVPANRNFSEIVRQFLPEKSKPSGAMFLLSQHEAGVNGRLKFAEWFQNFLTKQGLKKIFIFDPYFDTAGIDLIAQAHSTSCKYVVFTTQSDGQDDAQENTTSKIPRTERIVMNCSQMGVIFKGLDVKIYALPSIYGGRKAFHDRFIIGADEHNNSVSGFHLSNSIQTIQVNYPLLITPIPQDVLGEVAEYIESLLHKTAALQDQEGDITKGHLIFDSSIHWKHRGRPGYSPYRFAGYEDAGDVLASWLKNQSLSKISGDELISKLQTLGYATESGLNKTLFQEFGETLSLLKEASREKFRKLWNVTGILLANLPMGNQVDVFAEFSDKELIAKLFLVIDPASSEMTDVDTDETLGYVNYWNHSFDWLRRMGRGAYDVASRKLSHVDWPEYYAIKILWRHDPEALIQWLERHFSCIPQQQPYTKQEAIAVVVGSQIVSEIALSSEFGVAENLNILLGSKSALLKWLGFCSIENYYVSKLRAQEAVFEESIIPAAIRRDFVSWALGRRSDRTGSPESDPLYDWLYSLYFSYLPENVDERELKNITEDFRCRMNGLQWQEPWITNCILIPLLDNNRIDINVISKMWFDELQKDIKNLSSDSGVKLFSLGREGVFTALVAYYASASNTETKKYVSEQLAIICKKCERVIHQPLASTINWSTHDTCTKTIFWCAGFLRWIEYFSADYDDFVSLRQTLDQLCEDIGIARWESLNTGGSEYSGLLRSPPITITTQS